jgi:hypothetical protein
MFDCVPYLLFIEDGRHERNASSRYKSRILQILPCHLPVLSQHTTLDLVTDISGLNRPPLISECSMLCRAVRTPTSLANLGVLG